LVQLSDWGGQLPPFPPLATHLATAKGPI